MPPIAISGIFFAKWGGCWLGPGSRNCECQTQSALTPKLMIFRMPLKATPSGPRRIPGGPLVLLGARFGTTMASKTAPNNSLNPGISATLIFTTPTARNLCFCCPGPPESDPKSVQIRDPDPDASKTASFLTRGGPMNRP